MNDLAHRLTLEWEVIRLSVDGFQYRVRAVNGGGSSDYSTVVILTVPSVPAAPSALAASAAGANGKNDVVALTWTDNVSDETGFTIQRSLSPTFTTVTTYTVAANSITWTENVPRNNTFYYRIAATDLGGSSAWSNVASVKTP